MIAFALALALAAAETQGSQAQPSAAAPSAATTPSPSSEPSQNDPKQVVCRYEDIPGSNIRRRACRTRAEWDAQEQQLNRFFRNANQLGGQSFGSNAQPGF